MAYAESRSLLKTERAISKARDIPSSSSEDWSSSYSSDSPASHHSSEESYVVEWESHINKHGNLFYLEYNAQAMPPTQAQQMTADKNALISLRNDFNRTSTRRSKKSGIHLSKIISRHDKVHTNVPKRPFGPFGAMTANRNASSANDRDTNKVKFNELAEGELKEITVFIDPAMRHKFGRRTSVSEALLGLSVCPFPNSSRIMVAGYMPNADISQDKTVKIGDWLKAINDQDVNTDNFELILLSITQPTHVRLQLKRIAVEEQVIHPNVVKATNLAEYLKTLKVLFPPINDNKHESMVFSIMYLSTRDSDSRCPDDDNVIFSYPPKESNCLYGIRGTFLTLNSLFREATFNSKPKTTTISIKETDYFVAYHSTSDELVLLSLSSKYARIEEVKPKMDEILRYLELLHRTLSSAFPHHSEMPSLSQVPCDDPDFSIIDTLSIITHQYLALPLSPKFEEMLKETHFIALPKECQLRIDDALSEMEAMDYREWNEDPLKSHREFYILGSALYFRKYLLASHLPPADLLEIEAFLRLNGIYLLMDNKSVRDMVIWHEIYPKTVERGLVQKSGIYSVPKGRWFLTIVARHQMFMAVILESRHFDEYQPMDKTSLVDANFIGPSSFYIEEIQDTLDHLRSGGVESLASTWLSCNKRPEVLRDVLREDLRTVQTTTNAGNGTHPNVSATNALGIKKTEVISILKRRNNSTENVGEAKVHNVVNGTTVITAGSSSVNSQTYSDSSVQKFEDDDDGSDSDWDGFPESQRSSSGFDMSDMTSTFLREVSDVVLSKITAGKDNVLLHYVQIEVGEGVLVAPQAMQIASHITFAFRKACLLIHNILQNTIRFRYLLSQESSKPNLHRSLVAIKEHGILISTVSNTGEQIEFWVIGRLFATTLKELYVCHRADVPQNLVEVAFRLALHSAG